MTDDDMTIPTYESAPTPPGPVVCASAIEMTVPTYEVEPTPVVRGPRLGIRPTANRAAQLGIAAGANARAARLGIGSALGNRAARLGLTSAAPSDETEKSA